VPGEIREARRLLRFLKDNSDACFKVAEQLSESTITPAMKFDRWAYRIPLPKN